MGAYDGRMYSINDTALRLSNAQALPNNNNADSTNVIDTGGTDYHGIPVWLVVDVGTHTTAGGTYFYIKVLTCDTVDGTYEEICRKYFGAAEAIGGRHIIGLATTKRFFKLNYVTTDDLSAHTATAYLKPIF